MSAARRRDRAGFTLAEMLVATMLLSIVMTSVYSLFNSTLGAWRAVEDDYDVYQQARTAVTLFGREWDNMVSRAGHLFEGEDDEITMYVVTEPLEVEDSEGARMMQVRYRFNRTAGELIREERAVTTALPHAPPKDKELDRTRIKLGPESSFVVATEVESFDIAYLWVPNIKREERLPPPPAVPVRADKQRERWGYPQGIELRLTLKNPRAREEDFAVAATFPTRAVNYPRTQKELDEMLGSAD